MENRRRQVRNWLLFATIGFIALIIIGIIFMPFVFTNMKFSNIIILVLGPIILIGSWIMYFYQGRLDKENDENKVFSTVNKVSGGYLKLKGTAAIIFSIALIIFLVYSFFSGDLSKILKLDFGWIILLLIIFVAAAGIFIGIGLWQRAKRYLEKGRYY